MICLKEGIFDLIDESENYKIFQQLDRFLAVYYDFSELGLENLKIKMNKINGQKTLYCFTLDNRGLDKESFTDWKNITIEPIPQKILDVYRKIYSK